MGIQGLLKKVQVQQGAPLQHFSGRSFVIDGHCLLHRDGYRNAQQIVLHHNFDRTVTNIANTVRDFIGISRQTFLVFDGGYLPSKCETNTKRLERRQEAMESLKQLDPSSQEYRQAVQSAVHFSRDDVVSIANRVRGALNSQKLFVLLSPYEADAQMVHLCRQGYADVIVTIDSDLLVYGCADLYTKYDQREKVGDLITRQNVFGLDFAPILGRTDRFYLLRKIAVLSGCDYVQSLRNIGIQRAAALLMQNENLLETVQGLLLQGKNENPYGSEEEYLRRVLMALFTFEYQVVFDIAEGCCCTLTPVLGDDQILQEFLGATTIGTIYDRDSAVRVCLPGALTEQLKRTERPCRGNQYNNNGGTIATQEGFDSASLRNGTISINGKIIATLGQNTSNNVLADVFKSVQQSVYRD